MNRLDHLPAWPRLLSDIGIDRAVEEAARGILVRMTVEEKIGQMIQPDLVELTAEDVRDYRIGSALNGAGRWPGGNRRSGAKEWARTISGFWEAAEEAYRDRPFRIPFMWASDAVHGHNNVHGATIFPHNIGLGAARDPELVRRIGAATAREVAATGMDWTFAPTVTTPRDLRWGRCYEGYSQDPEIVHAYAHAMVKGLQGEADSLRAGSGVVSCVKHWVGDGGTFEGEDRGIARCSEDELRNVHSRGFFAGIEAGAQSVMVTYSGWEGSGRVETRVHGSEYLITDVLKDALGFDGIVIGDWDAHPYVEGCTPGDAGNVIRAGVDVLMVSTREKWQAVYHSAVEQVRSGAIPMSRVDDAVLRILRVKQRAGLWDKQPPAERRPEDRATALGAPEHRELARTAVRKSLVLLKHDNAALPLARTSKVLITGSAADAVRKQTGGYTVTWQGDDVGMDDFPGGFTVADAVRYVVGEDRCTVDPHLEHADPSEYDVVLVAIGEDPYAEMFGDIKPWRSIAYAELKPAYAHDLAVLRRLREFASKVVTVAFGGRPLYMTEEINLSDAFVAAWLPGPDARGITDLLFLDSQGQRAHDFQGRLSFVWPRGRHAATVDSGHEPLFPYGYGLTLRGTGDAAAGSTGPLPLDEEETTAGAPSLTASRVAIGPGADPYVFEYSATDNGPQPIAAESRTETAFISVEPIDHLGHRDAISLTFRDIRTFVYARESGGKPYDLRDFAAAGGRLSFHVRVFEAPAGPFHLTCHDDYPQQPALDIADRLRELPVGEWVPFDVPLAELVAVGVEFDHVDVPFMVYTEQPARLDIGGIQLVATPRA